jgi:hypothetical protein
LDFFLWTARQTPLTSPGTWWGRRPGCGTWLRAQGSTSWGGCWRAPAGSGVRGGKGAKATSAICGRMVYPSACAWPAAPRYLFSRRGGAGRGAAGQSESGAELREGEGGVQSPKGRGATGTPGPAAGHLGLPPPREDSAPRLAWGARRVGKAQR